MHFLQFLENQGNLYFLRTQTGMVQTNEGRFFKTGKQGAPDIVVCWNPKGRNSCVDKGRFIGIEIKAEKGKQSPAQKEAKKRIENAGGIYLEIRDVNQLAWLRE
jgi:hypothetical protein